jgi:hypothetical protein
MESLVKKVTRRDFLKYVGAGALGMLALPKLVPGAGRLGGIKKLAQAGKKLFGSPLSSDVVLCYDQNATSGSSIIQPVVQAMIDSSILALTGLTDVGEAWKSIFPGIAETSIIGIKINCINSSFPAHPAVITSIVNGLAQMNFSGNLFPKNNAIIWDRTDSELTSCGFTVYTGSDPNTVRCFGSSHSGVGYDNAVTFSVNGASVHPSKIISQMCDYIIDAALLRTHSQGVVTLSMKNHYGTVNSPGSLQHTSGCSPAIPALNQQIRDVITPNNIQKIFIIDGLFGLYSGGPGGSPNFNPKYIIMSKDPVACDYEGQAVINIERQSHGMGALNAAQITTAAQAPYSLGTTDINLIRIDNPSTAVEEPGARAVEDGIIRVSPDPFRDRTEITLALSRPQQVKLDLVNAAGRTEANVFQGRLAKGRHQLAYQARRRLSKGSYFFRLQGPAGSRTRRVTVVE